MSILKIRIEGFPELEADEVRNSGDGTVKFYLGGKEIFPGDPGVRFNSRGYTAAIDLEQGRTVWTYRMKKPRNESKN